MAFQTDSPADNQHAFPFHPTDHCYCLLSAFLYYASKSAILNLLIIPRRLSASLLICWLAAAHCWEVAEFVCTTSLIWSMPSLICWISEACVSSVSAIFVTSFVIALELSASISRRSIPSMIPLKEPSNFTTIRYLSQIISKKSFRNS